MALVMTSLILVQTNSILKALEIKEEQFNTAVNSALTNVSYQLERDEASLLAERGNSQLASQGRNIYLGK